MKGNEHLAWVNDKEGNVFICGLDCEVGSEMTCTWDSEREAPRRFEELLEHERNSCQPVEEILGTDDW